MNPEQDIIPNFTFEVDTQFDSTCVKKIDFLPDNQCFVLYNLFTKLECDQIIKSGEEYGFLDLANRYSQNYRNNQRIINYNDKLKQVLFERILVYVDNDIEIINKHPTITTTFYTSGKWKIDNLNDTFRLCKYNPSNYFKKHYDEGFHPNPTSHRSLKTCMLYLNDDFEGGETVFYLESLKNIFNLDELFTTISLKPTIGMCLIFNQNILHEGLTVNTGLKYFIRTDILYIKTKSYVDENLTDAQRNALEYYEQGVEFERNDKHEMAISMYKKAHKIYDQVEALYTSLYN
jgi:Rps23 Pro-64 3,4-dihydroxylase Tpa1-like proline 4-hydroxylase